MSSSLLLILVVLAAAALGIHMLFRHMGAAWQLSLAENIAATDDTHDSASPQSHFSPEKSQDPTKYPAIGSTIGLFAGGCVGLVVKDAVVPALGIGLSFGYLIGRFILHRANPNEDKALLFHLPMVVEKLLIAVQSGLDVVPALRIAGHTTSEKGDPASRAFAKVVSRIEQGATVESALEQVAADATAIPLKHVLLHLKVAHSRGGDLTFPLRELADATQVTYEQNVEEEIAVLPIKATAPLLCTFLGLLIVFLTAPIIGVVIASKAGSDHDNMTSFSKASLGEKL